MAYIHAVLHQALKQAVKEQLVIRKVCDAVNKPKIVKHEIRPLNIDRIKAFMRAVANHRFEIACILECYTGMRRGELLGLRWQDVDFDHQTVSVRKSLIRTNEGLMMSEPKTKRSYRTIPITGEIASLLRQHKQEQDQKRTLAGRDYVDNDLVFCNDFGRPVEPRNFVRQFDRVLQKANLPKITFHDMRHSHATMLLVLNEHPKVVQERLGHSSIAITLDTYSHIMRDYRNGLPRRSMMSFI